MGKYTKKCSRYKRKKKGKTSSISSLHVQSNEHPPTPQARVPGRSITELPQHIVADILSRVPAKSIFSFRCVCKSWLYLTSIDSHFTSLHFSRSPVELMVLSRVYGPFPWSKTIHLVDLEFDTSRGHGAKVEIKQKFDLPDRKRKRKGKKDREYRVVSSCNGLLCLEEKPADNPCIVCNPITGEYVLLPRPKDNPNGRSVIASGFGFDPTNNQYKVLRMFYGVVKDPVTGDICGLYRLAEILVVGSDSWRGIGYAPFSPHSIPYATFLNGIVHWACDHDESSDFIIFFDFASERFGEILPPSVFGEKHIKNKRKMGIGVLGGFLSLCDVTPKGHLDIWVMKEYGVQESWSVDFVVDTMRLDIVHELHHRKYPMIKYLSNGEILMVSLNGFLVCYDPLKKHFRFLNFSGKHDELRTFFHTPSFVALKDVLMGDNLRVLNVKSRCAKSEVGEETEALLLEEYWSSSVERKRWSYEIENSRY